MMALEALHYSRGQLEILDQLRLPHEKTYIPVKDSEAGWSVIKKMQVRGAPAIGIVGSLSLAVELHGMTFTSSQQLQKHVADRLAYLVTARPTAVNMADAEVKLNALAADLVKQGLEPEDMKERLLCAMEQLQNDDIGYNKAMGAAGADDILKRTGGKPAVVLTHCNTGSLATAGYGTALGVVRALHERGQLTRCYCTETRPYNQGSRLTAYELVHDNIASTLICDNMAAALMSHVEVSAVVIGADRIVSNGDTANKIGSYQLALVAKHHAVPFYVVAPSTSVDLREATGREIVIEERPPGEMTHVAGQRIAAAGIECWNPAFDVTPAELITGGIVTEFGLFTPGELKEGLTKALAAKSK